MCAGTEETPPTVSFPSVSLPPSHGSRWIQWEGHNTGEGVGCPFVTATIPTSWWSWWSCSSYLTSYTPSLPVLLEGFTEPLKQLKCSQVFECPSIYLQLRSWKNIVKHEPSCESCFPLWQTGKCWLWSSLIPMDLSHLLSSLHRGPTKASGTVHRAPNKRQPGSSLQFSGSPAPFVRWYQLWYFKERCQKCKNEQLRINLLVGMGICLPLLIAL